MTDKHDAEPMPSTWHLRTAITGDPDAPEHLVQWWRDKPASVALMLLDRIDELEEDAR